MTYPIRPIPQATIDIVLRLRREDAAESLALVSVETNGVADEGGLPPFLFEPATFYRRLPDDTKRTVALRAGVAARKWSKLLYKAQGTHANRVKLLRQAVAIDEEAAYESVSVGLGQVMGFHYAELGYATARAMFEAFTGSVEAQLRAMFQVADAQGVLAAMKARDWAGAARRYNGPQYRQNDYDTKLSVAYAHWECSVNTGLHQSPAADSGVLGLGSSGPVVKALQEMLSKAAIATKADDDFGPIMVGSIAAFQGRKGISTAVGLIDQGTADAIATAASESPLGLGARETASMAKVQAAVPRSPRPPRPARARWPPGSPARPPSPRRASTRSRARSTRSARSRASCPASSATTSWQRRARRP